MTTMDKDGSGTIDFNEFLLFMTDKMSQIKTLNKIP